MTPFIILGIGSLLFVVSIAIAVWPAVRVLRLQNDLLALRVAALEYADSEELFGDEAYNEIDDALAFYVGYAPHLTFTRFVVVSMENKNSENHKGFVTNDEVLCQIANSMCIRIAMFLLVETFTGMVCCAVGLSIIGWRRLRSLWNVDRFLAFEHQCLAR